MGTWVPEEGIVMNQVIALDRSVGATDRVGTRARPTALVNDVHAKLNPVPVAELVAVRSVEDVVAAVSNANGRSVSVCGGRHAMGGQQFGFDNIQLDLKDFNRVIDFDPRLGTIEVEAGIEWPKLIRDYHVLQHSDGVMWGIAQKQTGADQLSIGGAIAANIHGRGLTMQPFVQDVLEVTVLDADGNLRRCSREHNQDLFALVVGGYGLFGVVVSAKLQLHRRQKVQRIVEMTTVDELMDTLDHKIAQGYRYGDFQFAIDPGSDDFLRRGICSCYRPVDMDTPIPRKQRRLSSKNWEQLLYLAHVDKTAAFQRFRDFYLATSGQIYWSDTHQLSIYLDDYHGKLDRALHASHPASEVITELYVPRRYLAAFLGDVRRDFRCHDADLVYGTVRLIEADDVSYLAWAKEPYACVIFNLHTEHSSSGIARSRARFRSLIDIAIEYGGSYFLTYHRFASRRQVLACYPQFPEFLRRKLRYDPTERFQSDWYRHYRQMFAVGR